MGINIRHPNLATVISSTPSLNQDNVRLNHELIPTIISKTDPTVNYNAIYFNRTNNLSNNGSQLIGTKITVDQMNNIVSNISNVMKKLPTGIIDNSKVPGYVENNAPINIITRDDLIIRDDFSVITQSIVDSTYGIGSTDITLDEGIPSNPYSCRSCYGACSGTCGSTCSYTDRIGVPKNYLDANKVSCYVNAAELSSNKNQFISGDVTFNLGIKDTSCPVTPYNYPFDAPYLAVTIDKVNLPLHFKNLENQYSGVPVEVELGFRIWFEATVTYSGFFSGTGSRYDTDNYIVKYTFNSEFHEGKYNDTGRYNVSDGFLPAVAWTSDNGLQDTIYLTKCHASPINPDSSDYSTYLDLYLPHKCNSTFTTDPDPVRTNTVTEIIKSGKEGKDTKEISTTYYQYAHTYTVENYTNEVRYTGGPIGNRFYDGNYIGKLGTANKSKSTFYIPLNQLYNGDRFSIGEDEYFTNYAISEGSLQLRLNRLKINGRFIDLDVENDDKSSINIIKGNRVIFNPSGSDLVSYKMTFDKLGLDYRGKYS